MGIICFYRNVLGLFRNAKGKILRFFCGALSVTISTQLILMPVCIYYFGKISIISFVKNVIVTPLMGIILYLGIIFYMSTFIFQYAATLCSFILLLLLKLIPKSSVTQLLLFFLFLFCMRYFENKKGFIFFCSYFNIKFFIFYFFGST
jgi:competence protein ComEC